MTLTLGGQLGSIRDHFFVGRQDELAAADDLLSGATERRVLYIHGMGGIGKSELLRAIGRRARASDWDVVLLDARDLPADAEKLAALLIGTGVGEGRRLIMLDSFELLAGLERPFREQVLPALPASWCVILAGRNRLGAAWTADPGWNASLRSIAVGELSTGEATHYLQLRKLDLHAIEEVLDLAGGLPLALALASDAPRDDAARRLADDPDVVEALLGSVIERAPSPTHARVLAASAFVRRTTEELVGVVVGEQCARELFEWLASRPFFRADTHGIYPHDLVRQLLIRRLQWQRPELVLEFLQTTGAYHVRRLSRQLNEPSAPGIARDIIFLMAHGDVAPLAIDGQYGVRVSEVLSEDWPDIERILERQAGKEAINHLRAWRDHPAFEVLVVRRGAPRAPHGFFVGIHLHRLSEREAMEIPGVDVFYQRFGPFQRPAAYLWLWGDQEAGHDVTPTQTCTMNWVSDFLLAHPDVEHSALAVEVGQAWLDTGTVRTSAKVVPECTFQLGRTRYAPISKTHEEPPTTWFLEMSREWLEMLRQVSAAPAPRAHMPSAGAVVDALKGALKRADRPDTLDDNPLLDLHVVSQHAAGATPPLDRGRALVTYLRHLAAETLASPRDELHHRALVQTYFEPAWPKGHAVAAALGMGYSTYRRYLATAIERLASVLLHQEIEARRDAQGGTD